MPILESGQALILLDSGLNAFCRSDALTISAFENTHYPLNKYIASG
jgi:hypothetical protein